MHVHFIEGGAQKYTHPLSLHHPSPTTTNVLKSGLEFYVNPTKFQIPHSLSLSPHFRSYTTHRGMIAKDQLPRLYFPSTNTQTLIYTTPCFSIGKKGNDCLYLSPSCSVVLSWNICLKWLDLNG